MTLPRALFLLPLAALCGCTHLFFQPSKGVFSDPAAAGLKYEVLKFPSEDGTQLTGMFFPAAGEPLATVVDFHGNADNMTAHYPYSAWLAAEGFNVFIVDYRGYGASEGAPTLDGVVMDARASLAHALKLPGARADKIVVFGQSLGGAIAVAAVAQSDFKPAALVLEGTFHSYRGVAAASLRRHWLTWGAAWLPWVAVSGRHSPADYIVNITCPKLFLHAQNDPTVPFAQGKKLYDAAPGPKEFWPVPDGHIEAFGLYREVFGPRLVGFLKNALPG
ncbi:MAG: alpha/beta hydrolase [Elusimicrobiales bacterium]|nr:alpha/beta hydrolase [Elusimicrobiales bacterium]